MFRLLFLFRLTQATVKCVGTEWYCTQLKKVEKIVKTGSKSKTENGTC